jgi:hypothetical protein
MNALLEAIEALFNASDTLQAAFSGGIVIGEKDDDDDTQRPYLQVNLISGPVDLAYTGSYFGDIRIQFTAKVETHSEALTAAKVVCDVFDAATPTLSAGTITNILRQTAPIPIKERPDDDDGEDVWFAPVDYIYSVDGV